jgi:hypothetical protein
MERHHAVRALALGVALAATSVAAQPVVSAGHELPFKLVRTPGGNFLLAEAGTGADDGQVTLLSAGGHRFRVLGGLPSAVGIEGITGPTAVADAHTTIYVVIGEGDTMGEAPPPTQAPNPDGLSSPIFSSVIRARFTPVPDGIREGFELTAEHIQTLADGHEVALDNDSGEHVELLLMADFRDLTPDPILVVRNSNPFSAAVAGGLTAADLEELGFGWATIPGAEFLARLFPDSPLGRRLAERSKVYVADAGGNTVYEIDADTGRWRVLARIPRLPNPLFPTVGGPTMDSVPTSVFVRDDGDLLVTLLPGFPFPTTGGKVLLVDPETGAFVDYVTGLSMATQVLEVGHDLYVLELSTDFLAGALGRILHFAAPDAAPTVVTAGLIGAAGMVYDPANDQLIVSEAFTGRVLRVPLGD